MGTTNTKLSAQIAQFTPCCVMVLILQSVLRLFFSAIKERALDTFLFLFFPVSLFASMLKNPLSIRSPLSCISPSITILRKNKARLFDNLIGSEEIEGVCFWDQGMGGTPDEIY